MPIRDDVELLVAHVERAGEHADLAGDLAGGERLRTRPIFPVRQKAQAIAQPTCVEMQNVIDGVSGIENRLELLAVFEAQQEFLGAVDSISPAPTTAGVVSVNSSASVARSFCERSVIAARSVTPRL